VQLVFRLTTRHSPHPLPHMSNQNILRSFSDDRLRLIIASVIGLFASVAIGLVAVGSAGNPVKNLMLILGGVMLVLASLKPHFGLRLLILSSACLDLVKRFLVIFGVGSMTDVMGVLAVAPMILAGIFLGVFVLHPIFTKRMLNQDERRLTFLAVIPIGFSLVSGFRTGGLLPEVLGNTTNKSAYILLIPSVYALYRRTGLAETIRLLRFLVVVFVPVAIYGIQQYWFGLNQFEIDYLRSGLTSTVGNLYEVHPRAFSTLNSPHAFGIAMGIMLLLSLVLASRTLRPQSGFFSTRGRWLLPPLFAIASTLSLVRAGWVVAVLGLLGQFAFRTKARVIVFYTSFVLLFGILVWKADVVYARLDEFQRYLPTETDFQDQAFHLGTYSERLFGFQNMFTNRAMWTWFGNPDLEYRVGGDFSRDEIVHDAVGQMLVSHGIVGVVLMFITLIVSLSFLHRKTLAIRSGSARALGRTLLSVAMATFFGGMLTGNHIAVFPINMIFWCLVGALVTLAKLGNAAADGTAGLQPAPALLAGGKRSFLAVEGGNRTVR